MTIEKKCTECGQTFVDPKHPHKVTCSRTCAGKQRRKRGIVTCIVCDKPFEQKTQTTKCCSAVCAKISFGWRKGKTLSKYTMVCKQCGKPFNNVPSDHDRQFCSRACLTDYRRKNSKWINKKGVYYAKCICVICGKEYLNRHTTVLTCSKECKHLFYGDRLKKKIHVTSKTVKEILLEEDNTCRMCGFASNPSILELHHIDLNRRKNTRENLALLCPNCHTMWHLVECTGQFTNNKGRN